MSRQTKTSPITPKLCEWIQRSYWDGIAGWKLGTSASRRGLEYTADGTNLDPGRCRELKSFVNECLQYISINPVHTSARHSKHKERRGTPSHTTQLELEGRLQQRNNPGTHHNELRYLQPFQSQIIYGLLGQIAEQSPASWKVHLQQQKYVDFTPPESFLSCPCILKQVQQVHQNDHHSLTTTKRFDHERVRMPLTDAGHEGMNVSLVELLQANASQACATLTRKTRIASVRIPQQAPTGPISNNRLEVKLDSRMEQNSELLLPVAPEHVVWSKLTASNVAYRISQRTTLTVDDLEISLTTTRTLAPPCAQPDHQNRTPPNPTTHMLEVELTPNCYPKRYTPEQMKQQFSQCIAVLQSFRRILV
jgi:hypothetical protein